MVYESLELRSRSIQKRNKCLHALDSLDQAGLFNFLTEPIMGYRKVKKMFQVWLEDLST